MSSSGAGGSNNNNNAGPGPNANNDNDHQEVVPAANVGGGGGGVNIPRFRGDETEYFLSLIQRSVWLEMSKIHLLLTRRDMEVTPIAPIRPRPPALYMLPRDQVYYGVKDGYNWHDTKYYDFRTDTGEVITIVTARNTKKLINYATIVRKIYGLVGHLEMFLVHYKHKVPGDDEYARQM